MFVPLGSRVFNNGFSPNANANDLQLAIVSPACGESRRPPPVSDRVRGGGGELARLLPPVQRDLDLTCLQRPAGTAWIAKAKPSTHIR
jgi:hypothetical protein